jgi:hypothetical protein
MEWIQSHWVEIVAGYVLFIQVMKAIRDAIDTTPGTDDNWFERACTIMQKLGATLITGQRAK